MTPLITLYILSGCVGLAILVFVVMIVVTALRPPQLPDISTPPPLERMIRALTPLPFGPPEAAGSARMMPAPARMTPSVPTPIARVAPLPPPPPSRAPVVVSAIPRVAPPPPPPTMPPQAAVAVPSAPARRPSLPEVPIKPLPGTRRPVSLPTYPRRRGRVLLRVVLGMFVVTAIAAGAVVAYPALLDPACDDYEWFGADTATVVREHARDARASIEAFVNDL